LKDNDELFRDLTPGNVVGSWR